MAQPPSPKTLKISRHTSACSVLGPGTRGVIWVQGCPFRCPGCVAGETLPYDGGSEVTVDSMVELYADNNAIEGITFSGGEPMSQAAALVDLIDQLRIRRPSLSFMSYTGFLLETLRKKGTPSQQAFLDRLDLLVDGRYEKEKHDELLWRGSSNQTVHFLTERYRYLETTLNAFRGNQLEFEMGKNGGLAWMGIPPLGFREKFEKSMAARGIRLHVSEFSPREGIT